jgi:predicted nuclease of predicted toxin-antitoxin system
LRELGHDADTVVDEGLKSADDAIIAAAARQNGRMLFTLDRGLGDMRSYAPGEHPGIVVFRPRLSGPGTVNAFVEEFVRTQNLEKMAGCLVIVEPGKVRVRRKE